MFIKSNPHPLKLNVGDCVIRAIVHATKRNYLKVMIDINKYLDVTKSEVYNDDTNWKPYAEKELGFIKFKPEKKNKKKLTVKQFCKKYPKGIYLLRVYEHVTCCIDGNIYDTWDPSRYCVFTSWEKGV